MRSLIIIAAVGKNRELGYNNKLIWHFKEDLANFKRLTNGHYILMGRKTYSSLPKRLEGRNYLILSSTMKNSKDYRVFKDVSSFLEYYKKKNDIVYVIGGASVYKELLPYADSLILTEIDDSADNVDVYFPMFDKDKYDRVVLSSHEEDNITYDIVKYNKKLRICR